MISQARSPQLSRNIPLLRNRYAGGMEMLLMIVVTDILRFTLT
jgi:hypothetical protein